MQRGVIFDIKEFAVHDGPGVRQTVFLKGCPLRCNWCHNPEGWQPRLQLLTRPDLCISCGMCKDHCRQEKCIACGSCVQRCPVRARWVCGEELTSAQLAERVLEKAEDYRLMGGGVTFSGGEPLMQPEFLLETAVALPDIHKVLETCGYAPPDVFRQAMETFDLIYMDMKLADSAKHRQYTGRDNGPILRNLAQLCQGEVPFVVRIPLIPGLTDTRENVQAIAEMLEGAKNLQYVEFCPYNSMAGAKYPWLGKKYEPQFDEKRPYVVRHEIFARHGIESRGG